MKKIFVLLVLMIFIAGCGVDKKPTDPNEIPTVISTDENSDKKLEPAQPAEPSENKVEETPPVVAQEGKDYIVADDNFSNLQLDDPSIPVYDKYILWERQEKDLPVVLPYLESYYAESTVYLTFDDGPDDKVTPQILDILKAENVKATFYVCGNNFQRRARYRQSQLQSSLRRNL